MMQLLGLSKRTAPSSPNPTPLSPSTTRRYASELKKALTGDEVDDKAVCRIIGAHDKDEIRQIAASYEKK